MSESREQMSIKETVEKIEAFRLDGVWVPATVFQGLIGQTLDCERTGMLPSADLKALAYHAEQTSAEVERLRSVLSKISEARGRFSQDPLTYAENTIDDMVELATDALSAPEPKT